MDYIEFKNIEKNYGDNNILKNTNLSISKGELVTLLGPSGCGKSTLLRCLAGLEPLTSGQIYLDGKDITSKRPRDRNIGMVFQEYSLFPSMTVSKNIIYGLKRKKFSKEDISKELKEVLKMTDLEGKEAKYPSQLSGGEKQRVALARSIITKPKVLLLDEPLSAIDAKLRRALQDRIKEIHRELNMTTIFVTHDQDEAMRISDTIHLMNKGIIEQSGGPLEIYSNPKSLFSASFIGNYNIFNATDMETIVNYSFEDVDSVAIGPENIKIRTSKDKDYYNFEGVLVDILPLGNIIRYSFDVEGNDLKVDLLNENIPLLTRGEKLGLSVKKEDLILF